MTGLQLKARVADGAIRELVGKRIAITAEFGPDEHEPLVQTGRSAADVVTVVAARPGRRPSLLGRLGNRSATPRLPATFSILFEDGRREDVHLHHASSSDASLAGGAGGKSSPRGQKQKHRWYRYTVIAGKARGNGGDDGGRNARARSAPISAASTAAARDAATATAAQFEAAHDSIVDRSRASSFTTELSRSFGDEMTEAAADLKQLLQLSEGQGVGSVT